MYELLHMLQFDSQFLAIQGPSSHVLIVFCGASPKLSLVPRISWVQILHQWNLKELLCTKFVMRVVYFVHTFIVSAYVVG